MLISYRCTECKLYVLVYFDTFWDVTLHYLDHQHYIGCSVASVILIPSRGERVIFYLDMSSLAPLL